MPTNRTEAHRSYDVIIIGSRVVAKPVAAGLVKGCTACFSNRTSIFVPLACAGGIAKSLIALLKGITPTTCFGELSKLALYCKAC